jgi:hypothetical protein
MVSPQDNYFCGMEKPIPVWHFSTWRPKWILWFGQTLKCSSEMVSPHHSYFYGMEKPIPVWHFSTWRPKWILWSGQTIKCSSEMVSPHHNYFYGMEKPIPVWHLSTQRPKWILWSGQTIKCRSESGVGFLLHTTNLKIWHCDIQMVWRAHRTSSQHGTYKLKDCR